MKAHRKLLVGTAVAIAATMGLTACGSADEANESDGAVVSLRYQGWASQVSIPDAT